MEHFYPHTSCFLFACPLIEYCRNKERWLDGGAQNFISKLAAEHLADFNSPAEQKKNKKQQQRKKKNPNVILLQF